MHGDLKMSNPGDRGCAWEEKGEVVGAEEGAIITVKVGLCGRRGSVLSYPPNINLTKSQNPFIYTRRAPTL